MRKYHKSILRKKKFYSNFLPKIPEYLLIIIPEIPLYLINFFPDVPNYLLK